MRKAIAAAIAFLICGLAYSREGPSAQAPITEFEIGQHFFFDFGPPNDFYELFIVRSAGEKTAVQRISITPTGINRCIAPTKVEAATALLDKSVAQLLGKENPCAIPERELRKELKRCKKCLVFSGAQVTMRVACGAQTRLIRSDVLDRDMFDPAPRTPEHTSWSMRLVEQLEAPLGPGVVDRPMFPAPEDAKPTGTALLDPALAQALAAGNYDALFPAAPDKPSKLYEQSLAHPPSPIVELVSGSPFTPDTFIPPQYPPLARLTHVEGAVCLKINVNENGVVSNVTVEAGHPLLRQAATDAARRWEFPKGEPNRETQVTISFILNCPPESK